MKVLFRSDKYLRRSTSKLVLPGHFRFLDVILRHYQNRSILHDNGNRPWAVGQNYFASWHPCGKYLVWGLFERYIGTSLPKKSSQAKSCPIPRKWVINDYPLLNCITAKIGKFYNSITIKMTSIIGKRTKTRI